MIEAFPVAVLLIEDNPADMELMKIAIKEAAPKAVIHAFFDGKSAIQFLAQSPREITFSIIDLGMPVMNGTQVLNKMVALGLKQFPAYLISGVDWTLQGGPSLLAHAEGFWVKPTHLSELVAWVADLVHRETLGA